jgi:hypothetical protein
MATAIAEYYLDELVDWKRLVTFYKREMELKKPCRSNSAKYDTWYCSKGGKRTE